MYKSLSTIKSDAALKTFDATGENVVWAVLDTGVDVDHPHFRRHKNTDLPAGLKHIDFVNEDPADGHTDFAGHGTHVAGIIAGETDPGSSADISSVEIFDKKLTSSGQLQTKSHLEPIRGVAPQCKIISFKVLKRDLGGNESSIIAALEKINNINEYGKNIRIHGVNISAGYPFNEESFAAGHSPVCKAANMVARTGVVVVASAGNDGQGRHIVEGKRKKASFDGTINDPGNADHVITVGSTHRSEPHRYGVSFFSSKGPTADGRLKPDILAPGEKIVSAGSARMIENLSPDPGKAYFYSESGTSMAAPHVSGAVAALMSVRQEFKGEGARLKQIFVDAATDLGRDRYYQGSGLVDLMRAIQSV